MNKATILFSVVFLVGCTVGPNYRRPNLDIPSAYRAAPEPSGPGTPQQAPSPQTVGHPTEATASPSAPSFGDQGWWEVFQDPQLQELIRTALQQNYDVRIAAARILEAQAQLGLTRADQWPTIGIGASTVSERIPKQEPFNLAFDRSASAVGASMAWDLDFWGKYRRATEAARADLLATEWARRSVMAGLVGRVAAAYFQLRTWDLQLETARRTLVSRRESLQLTRTLVDGGVGTMLDVRQAEQLVTVAEEAIPDLERRIHQEENLISALLGDNPGPIARGMTLTEQPHLPEVPAGIPSRLLERRPDVRVAEAQLMAANAQIGIAKAAYFPQITLTANRGYQSSALTDLFTSPARYWNIGGSLAQAVFAGGRIKSGVRLTEARKMEMVLTYQQTVQQAFRGVSDALVGYQKCREVREHQEALLHAAQDAAMLADVRYRGGAASYLEVLTNETNAFNAELGLAQAQLNELLEVIEIYRNLGGGWDF